MTKEVTEVDPADIAKHPDAIKKALDEISSLDVLVCGTCHTAFHHVEAFTEHKAGKCTKNSGLKECRETKPKVWAFLLWKACQKKTEEDPTTNSWKLYQTWVKLDESVRETWIVAGKTIQSFARLGQGQVQEMPVKVVKQIVDSPKSDSTPPPVVNRGGLIKRPLGLPSKKAESEQDNDTATDEDVSPKRLPALQLQQVVRKPLAKPVTRSPGQLLNKNVPRLATRTMAPGETEEHTVDKILAKKFNPRIRAFEYLIKWVNFSHEQNTWEPQQHLDKCTVLLTAFENQLALQKEQRAAKAAEEAKASDGDSPTRLIRTVKKPPEQATLKRKNEDSDADTEEDTEAEPAKKAKNDAVNQALMRAGQSGTVRIVPVNKSGTPNQKATVNGATAKVEKNSAEVVITSVKDKPTGVMRKPGVTASAVPAKKEAQVSSGESLSSGIVRISPGSKQQQQVPGKVMPKLVPRVTPQTTRQVVQRPGAAVARTVSTLQRPGVRQISPQQPVVRNQTIIRRSVPAPTQQGRTMITRVVKSTPSPKAATPVTTEAKVMALNRQGDIKVMRKAPPKVKEEEEEVAVSSSDHEGMASPEPAYTLCPMTGELRKPGEEKKVKKEEEVKKESETVTAIQTEDGQIQQLLTNEDGSPLLVTGEDGTVYQVAGKNAEGQTLLIAQGAEGEQQCVYVAAEDGDESLLALSGDAVQNDSSGQIVLKEEGSGGAAAGGVDPTQQLIISTDSDSQDGNITAEIVQADQPSPGGTRRVVLMLPDGNFMMTEVKF
ncbi:uncharacterized protein LOC129795493 isoform X2 [Lutzomyia longipalpis]|uniref:uncharacterized protein LOC129795493 isoform X2 n=1 Tax=Lutzomyia longipalpis TaxID=7200 RepID=UPI002483A88E|nr:uncharacterized protein LOC129795493 isoform X2 [Lutzomyia longipalpis]